MGADDGGRLCRLSPDPKSIAKKGDNAMKLATTTSDFGNFCRTHEECVKLIYDAGFRYIDMGLGGARFFSDPNWRDEAKKLREYAESLGMKFVQAHSPNGNIISAEKHDSELFLATRSLELCEILGIPQVVVHAGYEKTLTDKNEWQEKNAVFYRELFPTMEKTGVAVLTENTSHANFADGYYMFTGPEMVEFIEYVNHPLFQAVWDTGHGNTEGQQSPQLKALGKHLYGLHVHDNTGMGDDHNLPYFGTMNMDDLMTGLIEADYKGYFTFEVLCAMQRCGHKKWHFPQSSLLKNPTLEMRIDVERLMYTIGKHCLEVYHCFEE